MRGSKALWITVMMTAGLIGLAVGLRGPYARLAAEHWRRELATVSDDRARVLLGRVADLGESGIPVLVEALGSQRERVARAASQVLLEQLNRWQNSCLASGAQKQAILADALANRVLQFGPTARNDAAELAGRMLLWLPDSAAVDRSRIIACCEKVLRAGAADRGWSGVAATAGQVGRHAAPGPQLPPSAAPAAGRPQRHRELLPPEITVAELAPFPGGGLPIDRFPSAAAGRSAGPRESSPSADIPATQPQMLAAPSGARPLGSRRQPRLLSGVADNAEGLSETAIPASQPQDGGAVKQLSATEVPAAPDLSAVETTTLMRRLRAPQKSQAAEALAELSRRGFGAVHLDLARRLFDPDPEVRKQLARALPGLQSVDAVPWLLWLGCDEDPEVRLVAITLMATTGDPTLRAQIEKLARQDPDGRIQELADRIGRQRSDRLR